MYFGSMTQMSTEQKNASTPVPPRRLQRAAINPSPVHAVPPIVHEVLRSPGQPLDTAPRSFMESRFGHDFSSVRVHTDAKAANSARSVNALAYTVGQSVVFGSNQYQPHTRAGQQLMAHELTHVVQQGGAGNTKQSPDALAINSSDDAFEQQASVTAQQVMTGASITGALSVSGPAIQRQTPGGDTEQKPPEKKDTSEVVAAGVKTVVEQATGNNAQVKKVILDPIKDKLKGQWNRLDTGEKAATIGLGAATLGTAGGALLSDPGGRKRLEGVNLATPLTLIPYMPLRTFKYTLPSGNTPDKRFFKFETGLNADELLNLYTQGRDLPKMSLSVNMQWGYDPQSERLTILGGDASLGLVPGLSLSAGAYKDILRPPQTVSGPEGQTTQIKQSIPEFGKPQPIPDVRIMLNVDLLKFNPGDLARQIKGIFR